MCSLRYEHEFYVQARRRFPKEGKTVRTAAGEERVMSNDIFRERVVLRNGEGETRTIPLSQLLQESEAAGSTIIPAAQPRSPQDRPTTERRSMAPLVTPTLPMEAVAEFEEEGTLEDEDVAVRPTADASPETPSSEPTASAPGEKRPHRRRGRRGGRRNRGGKRDGNSGTQKAE
jgi:hypothetical protein